MLRALAAWWMARMREMLPPRWRAGALPPDALLVTLRRDGDADLAQRRRGRETPLGRLALDPAALAPSALAGLPALLRRRPRRVLLRPVPGALLERAVVLPLAAQHDPAGVLRYELDRLTPFAAEEVFWAWRQEARDVARNALHLRLSLLPRAALAAPIEALRRAGLPPAGLEATAADGTPRAIPLGAAAAPSPRRAAWRRRGLALAGTCCAGLAIAAAALPFALQSLTLAEAERQIEALRPRVAEAEALRRRMAEAKGGQDAFAAERARVGDALQAIAAITDILPDDTWLTELTLRQRRLGMAGRSAGAARLIGLLSADPTIRDAAFAAPVTRTEGTRAEQGGGDAFSIRAEMRM